MKLKIHGIDSNSKIKLMHYGFNFTIYNYLVKLPEHNIKSFYKTMEFPKLCKSLFLVDLPQIGPLVVSRLHVISASVGCRDKDEWLACHHTYTHEVYFSGFEIKTSFYYMRCIEKLEIDISLTRHDFFHSVYAICRMSR